MDIAPFGQAGQGWTQLAQLALALVLSAAIGLEREIRQQSAGLRTHTTVGFAAALIMLVSKFGFGDVIGDHVVLDPSRVAAQIVSGIGFLGAGLIFVRRDAVRGLTTAAVIWLTAAVGMAAGAGLWLPAIAVTAGHYLVMFAFTPLVMRLPQSRHALRRMLVTYQDRHGALPAVLSECTRRGFTVTDLSVARHDEVRDPRLVTVRFTVQGPGAISELTAALAAIDGVVRVSREDAGDPVVP
ncbi:MgtC/SapB family protein [Planotetraspora kaengkrachanensis]|uniref:Membrane protein n=1 Tax=Planotetraspora kaengkrachanensis TaxID=575193 RepID=A0A8J3PXE9_9ACTN|nr:MgtC/SapB family protein [Planotetraspora kaengkrachanensis]GIG82656.1 membrane protein [Planotetraspora kaengkrachanensis]